MINKSTQVDIENLPLTQSSNRQIKNENLTQILKKATLISNETDEI